MNKIILQPAGNTAAIINYQNTVLTPISLERMRPFLPAAALNDLQEIYPAGNAMLWGAAGNAAAVHWQRIDSGDIALFSRAGAIYSAATVTYKIQSPGLAGNLWGEKTPGLTWEYIFFLDELRPLNITYATFNEAAGYLPNNVIQGFTVLNEARSQDTINAFGLASDTYAGEISPDTFSEISQQLDGLQETDAEVRTYRRLEQAYLKRSLFGRRTLGSCAICGHEYPVSLLVAAHIKKRADCTLAERLDVNVVMPVCKFGCDDLFEKGFLTVIGGTITSLNKQPSSARVDQHIATVAGQHCSWYNAQSAGYFAAHHASHQPANL